MGFMDKLLGSPSDVTNLDDYAELEADSEALDQKPVSTLHLADYDDQRDLMVVKDAIYEGDIVVLNVSSLRGEERTLDRVADDLQQTIDDMGGDIVQGGDDMFILTPRKINISREKLTR